MARLFNSNYTIWLIGINVAVFFVAFILMVILGQGAVLNFIALKPGNILSGNNLWTILTSMFMHGSFFHIFANMLTLLFIGSLVEKILGKKRYLYFYLLTGIIASLFFIAIAGITGDGLNQFAVGASGAVFGLIGFLVLITPNLTVYLMFIPIPIKMKYAGPGILVLLWLISLSPNLNIGNTAHLGGLLVGVVYGFYLKNKYPRKTGMISRHFS